MCGKGRIECNEDKKDKKDKEYKRSGMAEGIRLVAAALAITAMILCTVEDISRKKIRLWKLQMVIGANLILAWCGQVGWKSVLLGMVPGIIFMIISICTEEKLGKGDALLVMGAGICLGPGGILMVVFVALLLSSGYGLLLLHRKKGKSYEMAFVPFMLFPYASAILFTIL